MGALPSRETHRRGLYSHRHGRNRRSEVVLIPLTSEFFPDKDCPLFKGLFQARHQRTAKYYYRAVRPVTEDYDSDFYCQTTAHAYDLDLEDPEGPNKDGAFETSFSDSIEGLYQRLIKETEYCMCETDEELRQRYMEQLQQQQGRQEQTNSASDCVHVDSMNFGSGMYVSGYKDAVAYMQNKEQHTHRNKYGTHITSPSAFYLRPIPCAIVSRFDPQKPPATTEDGVEFLGFTVKVLGMFGFLPDTIPITFDGETIEQHMLKATMFVDKDVGDQIIGNVFMLAVHMYVRQCIEARIRAPYIPMIPFILRTPISNIPMLQFVREMRVRLQMLLDAGTLRNDIIPNYFGLNNGKCYSPAPVDFTESMDNNNNNKTSNNNNNNNNSNNNNNIMSKQDMDAFLFEEDIPNCTHMKQLFTDISDSNNNKWLWSHPSQNTNSEGTLPILMMSGVNVPTTPLKHSSLTNMSHVQIPKWAILNSNDNSSNGQQLQLQKEKLKIQKFLSTRRRNRFRTWIENGRLCIWASAAYARRGCLILAQQLTMTVDSSLLPSPRIWNYRGLLRSGISIPIPNSFNDVLIVQHDIPSIGLYQGDVLRCSSKREIAERYIHNNNNNNNNNQQQYHQRRGSSVLTPLTPMTTSSFEKNTLQGTLNNSCVLGINNLPNSSSSFDKMNILTNSTNHSVGYSYLQDIGEPPQGAFWVHMSYNHGGGNVPVSFDKRRRKSTTENQQQQQYGEVTYRQMNIEEILLSWIKAVSIQTRDILETDNHWVRNPITKEMICVDRYLIRRVEHDGFRYFIGVAPRFVGQQKRSKKIMGELKTSHGPMSNSYTDDGDDGGESSEMDNGNIRDLAGISHVRNISVSFEENSFSACEEKPKEDE